MAYTRENTYGEKQQESAEHVSLVTIKSNKRMLDISFHSATILQYTYMNKKQQKNECVHVELSER